METASSVRSIEETGGGGGTYNYNELDNKPQINSVELSGNKSSSDLGLQSALDASQLDAVNSGITAAKVTAFEGKQDAITSNSKLSADLVDDATTANKFVTAADKTAWNAKQNAIDSLHMLDADLVDDTTATHKFATAAQLSQITTNKNNISSIKEKTDNIMIDSNRNIYIQATAPTGTIPVGSTWISGGSLKGYVQESNVSTATIEQGTFNADGSEVPNNNRVRTTFDTDIYSMGAYTVSITGANDVLVFVYDSDKTCIQSEGSNGWESLPYSFNLAGDRYVRFAFRKTYDAAISPSDVSNYALAFQGWK